ncbi:MAG: hypothetical protein U0232_23605 [Thermomicrobiales bacterium]
MRLNDPDGDHGPASRFGGTSLGGGVCGSSGGICCGLGCTGLRRCVGGGIGQRATERGGECFGGGGLGGEFRVG